MGKLFLSVFFFFFAIVVYSQSDSLKYVINGKNKNVEIVGTEGISLLYPETPDFTSSGVFIKQSGINIFAGENIKIESVDNNIDIKSGSNMNILGGEILTLSGSQGANLNSGNLFLGIRKNCNIHVNSDENKINIDSDGEMGISVKNDLIIKSKVININATKTYYNGKVGIGTTEPRAFFDCADASTNSLKSVLARISEGNNYGEGSYLGTRSYTTNAYQKTFSIEHKFYGEMNSSIDFYRGGGVQGGEIAFSVNNGSEVARFNENGITVKGTIKANEVKIELGYPWADFVFAKDYRLPSLDEVKAHIDEHKHLPGIPSEAEIKENGIDLSEITTKMMQKIEELTLYVIKQQEEINLLKKKIKE